MCACFFPAQLDSLKHEATFCCCRLFLWALLSATLTIFNASHKSHMSAIFACLCVPVCLFACVPMCVWLSFNVVNVMGLRFLEISFP